MFFYALELKPYHKVQIENILKDVQQWCIKKVSERQSTQYSTLSQATNWASGVKTSIIF